MKAINIPEGFKCEAKCKWCVFNEKDFDFIDCRFHNALKGKTIYTADKGEKLVGVDVLDTILNLIEGWTNIEGLRGENENHPLVKVKELVSRTKE